MSGQHNVQYPDEDDGDSMHWTSQPPRSEQAHGLPAEQPTYNMPSDRERASFGRLRDEGVPLLALLTEPAIEHGDESYLPPPLLRPPVEQYVPDDPEPLEVPDIPRAVPPYASRWWYFPAPVLVGAALDWEGRPILIWKRPPQEPFRTRPVYGEHEYHGAPAYASAQPAEHSAGDDRPDALPRSFHVPRDDHVDAANTPTGRAANESPFITLERLAADWDATRIQVHPQVIAPAGWTNAQSAASSSLSLQQSGCDDVARGTLLAGQHSIGGQEPVRRTAYYEIKVEDDDDDVPLFDAASPPS